ncbi:unnamed protein product [Caretta caretta]
MQTVGQCVMVALSIRPWKTVEDCGQDRASLEEDYEAQVLNGLYIITSASVSSRKETEASPDYESITLCDGCESRSFMSGHHSWTEPLLF